MEFLSQTQKRKGEQRAIPHYHAAQNLTLYSPSFRTVTRYTIFSFPLAEQISLFRCHRHILEFEPIHYLIFHFTNRPL